MRSIAEVEKTEIYSQLESGTNETDMQKISQFNEPHFCNVEFAKLSVTRKESKNIISPIKER